MIPLITYHVRKLTLWQNQVSVCSGTDGQEETGEMGVEGTEIDTLRNCLVSF